MKYLIQSFFFALGGFSLWIYYLLKNIIFSENNRTDIGYYLFEEFEVENNSGFDINWVRFILGIFTFIFFMFLIDYFD